MHTPTELQSRVGAAAEAAGLQTDFDLEVDAEAQEAVDALDDEELADDLDATVTVDAVTTQANATGLTLSELDDLLAEEDGSELDSLDALLEDSLHIARAQKEAKAIARRIRTGQATPREVAAYAQWEAVAHWDPHASCEAWDRYICTGCGNMQGRFTGLMIEYRGISNPANVRWTKVHAHDPSLPRKFVSRDIEMPQCTECSDDVMTALLSAEPYTKGDGHV